MMTDETTTTPTTPTRGRPKTEISDEIREEILRLQPHYGAREIARRVGLTRKVVRGALAAEDPAGRGSPTSKLEPFHDAIAARVKKDLTVTRILREIQQMGYSGGRTILSEHIRALAVTREPTPKASVKRRFETAPGKEMQIDWSPYLVPIEGKLVRVHALGCLLCASRKLFLRFFADERQHTLLEGLACAFEYFHGAAARLVLDNMATAVLGRLHGGKPLWHPRFLDFVRHYGVTPFACKPRDPDRKGKKEKSFRLLYEDFIKGSEFDSWDDLERRCRAWLDETPGVANRRIHGTTRRVPNEQWERERPLLIALPGERFPVHEPGVRAVDRDATLSIHGTRYSVPAHLADRSVAVRLYAEHFEVIDPSGRIACSRRYAQGDEKGRLLVDPTHYANLPKRPRAPRADRLDEAFLLRFPGLAALADGLRHRMKALASIHFRALLRLVSRYGEPAFLEAATRAQDYRRYDALAVQRILEAAHPLTDDEPLPLTSGQGSAVLGEVDPGSLDGYAPLDALTADTPAVAPTPDSPDADASKPKT